MRAGPIISSRKSFGSLPSWPASSAMKDWIDQACATLLTERNQPTRTWLCASPLSMRMLGTLNGVSTHPMPSSMSPGCFGIGHEVGHEARRRAAVPPGDHLVGGVEAGLEALRRHGVIEAVADVVLARPHHLDRRAAHLLGQQCRLDGEVALGLAAEAAAEQRRVQRHFLGLDAQGLGDVVARAAGALHRRPHLPLAVAHARGGSRRLHGRVRDVGCVVLGRDHLGGRGQRLVDVALVALDLAGLASRSPPAAPCRPWSRRPCSARRPR